MTLYHVVNILVLFCVTATFIYFGSQLGSSSSDGLPQSFKHSWELYGWFAALLYVCQYLSLLALPQALFNFLGFVLYNPFPEDPIVEVCFTFLSLRLYLSVKYSSI